MSENKLGGNLNENPSLNDNSNNLGNHLGGNTSEKSSGGSLGGGNNVYNNNVYVNSNPNQSRPNSSSPETEEKESNILRWIAFGFMLLSTIAMGCFLIPLCWCIPMTIHVYRQIKAKEPISVGFKICTLLFVSVISGILLLCDNTGE